MTHSFENLQSLSVPVGLNDCFRNFVFVNFEPQLLKTAFKKWSKHNFGVPPFVRSLMSLFLSPSQIILKQLVDATKDLKDKCIFHWDIKVENILIETGSDVPRVRLIDFGMGCFFKKRSLYHVFYGKKSSFHFYFLLIYLPMTLTFKQSFSASSSLCLCIPGTVTHVPPEWYSHYTYWPGPTTVWQMGVVLFESLHGEEFQTTRFLRNKLTINNGLSESKKHTLIHKPVSRH